MNGITVAMIITASALGITMVIILAIISLRIAFVTETVVAIVTVLLLLPLSFVF